jgi:type II secretory pathway component PulF
MVVGDFVHNGWYLILLALVGFLVLVPLLKANEFGRFIVDAIKLRLPVIRGLLEMICLSFFTHHVGNLLGRELISRRPSR